MRILLRLWPFFRKYRAAMVWMLVCGALMSFCQAIITPVIAYLFDRVFSNSAAVLDSKLHFIDSFFAATVGNEPRVLVWAIPVACISLYFLNGLFRYMHFFLMRYTGDRVSTDLREALLNQYLHLNLTFHNSYSAGSGGLLSRTLNDVYNIQTSTGMFGDFVREPVLALLLLGYMIYVDWQLTLAIFLIAPVLILILRALGKSLRRHGHRHQEVLESMTSILKEALDGIRVIQSFNLEKKLNEDFHKKSEKYLQIRRKIVSREEVSGPASELIGALVFGGMAFYFGNKVLDQTSSPGVFLSFVTAMGFMQKPIKKIQDAFIRLQQTAVSTERILHILADTRRVKESPQAKPFPHNWKQIQFNDVSFSYETESVLQNFQLTVRRGEVIALVGTSGSGKSTAMHLLERFFDPSEGKILIDGVSTTEMKLSELRKNIALVTQDVFLFNDSIENNIRFGSLEGSNVKVEDAAQTANATGFIRHLPKGFENIVGERGNLLSGGEKQRISIARAVYKDAPILILDEATSALDSVSEIEVQKALEKLMAGRTVFMIAHRLSTVKNADRIIVLSKGRIVEQGTHQELLERRGEYYQFHQLQTERAE